MKGGLLRAAVATVPRLRDRREKARALTAFAAFGAAAWPLRPHLLACLIRTRSRLIILPTSHKEFYESISFFRRYSVGWAVR